MIIDSGANGPAQGREIAAVEERLNAAFGTHAVHGWPTILRERPRWWHFRMRRKEAATNAAIATISKGPITEEMRAEYWRQVRLGQCIYEDAGGYDHRCWMAALGLPYVPHRKSEATYIIELLFDQAGDR